MPRFAQVDWGVLTGTLEAPTVPVVDVPEGRLFVVVEELELFQRAALRGQCNGYASLDDAGLVPVTQLPSLGGGGPHTHPIDDVVDLQDALDGKAPSVHSHPISDVTSLQAALDAKAETSHAHAIADVTSLQTTLDAKQATSAKGQANGYAGLGVDGKVPAAQLPASGGGWTLVSKAADTDRRNNTLSADPDLQVALAASTKYRLRLRVHYQTGAAADFKWRHAGPAGFTALNIRRAHVLPGGTAFVCAMDATYSAADVAMVSTVANGQGFIELDAVVHNGGTAGAFEFRWAQNTTTAGEACIVRAGSYLEWQIA